MKNKCKVVRFGMGLAVLCAFVGLAGAEVTGRDDLPFAHLSVELTHPVYRMIDAAELRGAVARLSAVKPYTRAQVVRLLDAMRAAPGRFSAAELAEIDAMRADFRAGGPDGALWTSADRNAKAGVRIEATTRLDAAELSRIAMGDPAGVWNDIWHLNSKERFYLSSAPASWISGWGVIGITADKIERSTYLPYTYTKEWDTRHWDLLQDNYNEGDGEYPFIADDIAQDIAVGTPTGSFLARFARVRHDWGNGIGSLALSESARPFMSLETAFRPSEFFQVTSIFGSIGDRTEFGTDRLTDVDPVTKLFTAISFQKMMVAHRMELFPFPWLTVAGTTTMVGAKRFELGYFAPFVNDVKYQSALADIDNVAMQIDGQLLWPGIGKVFASFYADEMALSELETLFTKARQMFALQGGARVGLPASLGLPFGTLTAQYTKIEPFVYAHYPTWYADYRLRVDTSYTHDGENIGYRLPPNSDEFLIRVEGMPARGLRLTGEYSLIRHGDNPNHKVSEAYVFGDVTKWLEYDQKYGLIANLNKDFLHDGLYDWNHSGRVSVAWRPAEAPSIFGIKVPMELGTGYGLSYTYWVANSSGLPEPAPEWRHVIEARCTLFL